MKNSSSDDPESDFHRKRYQTAYWNATRICGFEAWNNALNRDASMIFGRMTYSDMADRAEVVVKHLESGGNQSADTIRKILLSPVI
jgi:hypothetical protein